MLRLICNENIPRSAIERLRSRGHDVASVKELLRGAPDISVLAVAQAENRIIVTQDKDFGELAFRERLPSDCGIILFRLAGNDPQHDAHRMIDVVESQADWGGQFADATVDQLRIRTLPRRPK